MTESSEQPQEQSRRLYDLIPPSWLAEPKVTRVLMSCHRAFRVTKAHFMAGPRVLDVLGVRVILVYGKVNYWDSSKVMLEFTQDGTLRLDASSVRPAETPEGPYTLFLVPISRKDQPGDEGQARQRLAIAAGLLAAFHGRNIIYEHLFDNQLDLETEQVSWFSPVKENPFWFQAPEITDEKLMRTANASQAIGTLATGQRNRLELSLRWFQAALLEGGVDAFLKYWIALETLAMPNTSDVRPVHETSGRIYNITYQEACERFLVGRISGLRNHIVHGGLQPRIDPRLESYLTAIYLDILFDRLGVPPEYRTAREMAGPEFNLLAYLPSSKRRPGDR